VKKKSEITIDLINEMIGAMASLEFNHTLPLLDEEDEFSTIVQGLFWLQEELEHSVVSKSVLEAKNVELIASIRESSDYKFALDKSAIVAITDSKGNIEYVNDMFCTISKFSRKELIGQNQRIVSSGFHNIDFWKEMWTTIGKGKTWRNNIKNKDKNGDSYWVDTTITPFLNEKGKPDKYLAIRFDITEAKRNAILLEKKNKEALRFQLKLLATQLNPNFIYTSMNSLQYAVLDQNMEKAINFTSDFSNLLRMVMQNSLKQYIPIKDEIAFLDKFLKMEQERNANIFEYEIIIKDIDPIEQSIPPMLLQTYVENAVIHGISKLKQGGKIKISFCRQAESILCSVEDNGVGRENAINTSKTRGESTLRPDGIGISENRVKILNQLEDGGFSLQIVDKKDSKGNSTGTLVEVIIPVNLEFHIDE